jgi:Ferritin-like domain
MSVTEREPQSALAEVADDPASRKKFLKMMGGTGAASALALAVAACGGSSSSSSSMGGGTKSGGMGGGGAKPSAKGDLAIVNYALTLEYLEADFYRKVAASGLFKGASLVTIKKFGEQEATHVKALEQTAKSLGTPAAKPKTKFPLKDAKSVLKLAAAVENLGSAAYLGQAPRIKDPKILAAALSIHSVEARHAAALNTLLGKPATPDGAFAQPMTMAQVLAVAKQFIVA